MPCLEIVVYPFKLLYNLVYILRPIYESRHLGFPLPVIYAHCIIELILSRANKWRVYTIKKCVYVSLRQSAPARPEVVLQVILIRQIESRGL